ncbi:fatty acid-binding protein [Plakobranchus ocellatus]|uniref:Fatty acid-binding protein n=1 Tax=Plakobranchus ocellatus TaxID=259542 RepID=A0AAV3ZA73_9GAST|nr:fatty acid-binding protein [Plakobranchus ocellatus]
MAEALIGSWKYEASENIEAYMDALGLPDNLREMARSSKPNVDISKDGTTWIIKTTIGDKVNETKYPENEEIDTINIMGQPTKASLAVEGASLVETQKFGGVEMKIKRSVEDGKYVVTMSAKGQKGKVKFTKA